MNNQVKLIEALREIQKQASLGNFSGNPDNVAIRVSNILKIANDALMESDTPPVPTIKPGDKVRYTIPDSMGEGKVISMIQGIDGIIGAMCLFDTGIHNIPLEYLEVLE
jgi:hypothetical protein